MTFGTDDNVGTTMTTTMVKTRVPSTNRRAILSVIDNQMNSAKVAWQTKYLTNVETNSSKVDFIINECIDKTGLCLKQQVLEMTTTEEDDNLSADEHVNEAMTTATRGAAVRDTTDPLDSFKMRQLQLTTIRGDDMDHDDDDDDVSHSSSSIDDITEDISFEEEELFDQDAHNQVKQLRSKARGISSNVIALREETTIRALDVVKRDLSLLLNVHGFASIQDDTFNNDEEGVAESTTTTKERKNDEEENNNNDSSLNPMNVAIQTLIGSIQTIDTNLSTKLEELKETIGTIDTSVNKWVDGSTLSQTEKAILASTDAQYGEETGDLLARRERCGAEVAENDESPMNPEKKLARLLAGIL